MSFSAAGQGRPEFVLQNGHSSTVRSVVFSPNGEAVASGSDDATVKIWDVSTSKLLRTLEGHTSFVFSVAFSPDGAMLLSGSLDHTVKIWAVSTGRLLRTLDRHTDGVFSVAFSPDGETFLSASFDGTLKVWDVTTGQLLRTLNHKDPVLAAAFSPDSATLASGGLDDKVKIWDVSTGKLLQTLKKHSSNVTSVVFSRDGKRLISGSDDDSLKVWDLSKGRLLQSLEGHADGVKSVASSMDGQILVSGSVDGTLKIWDASTGQILRTLEGHTDTVFSVALSFDDERLVSGSRDGTLRMWDVSTGQVLHTFEGHSATITSVAFSSDGEILASGHDDTTLKLWDVSTGQLLRTLASHTDSVTSVAFSPDGEALASGSDDDLLKVWDVSTGTLLRTLDGDTLDVSAVAFSADGEMLALGSSDGNLKVWDVSTGTLLRTFERVSFDVSSVAFSPDSERLVSGSRDKTLRVWDVATGMLLHTLEGHTTSVTSVMFSPAEEILVSASEDDTLRVWEGSTGQLLRILEGHTSSVTTVAFSPDGETLASGSKDNTLKVWDLSTGKALRTLEGHTFDVTSVAFSPDGETLVSGSEDTSLRFWRTADGEPLATSYAFGTEYLTFTSEGPYVASEGGEEFAAWRVSGEVYGFEQYAERFRKPELVAQRLAGRRVEIPGGVLLAIDTPPRLRWIEELASTESNEVRVVLAYEGKSVLEDLIVFFNGEAIPVDAKGKDRIEIPLSVSVRKNLLNAVAFDAKRLRSDPLKMTFEYVGARQVATFDVAFFEELPQELFGADEVRINQQVFPVVNVDAEKQTLKMLGEPGLLKEGVNWFEAGGRRLRFWMEENKLRRMPEPYETSYAVIVAIDDYDRKKDLEKRGPTQFEPLDAMVARAQDLKAALMNVGFAGGNITTLYDKDATSENIRSELQRFWEGGDRADADRVFFYFGGHGRGAEGQGYLVTYDYMPKRPTLKSFMMSEIVGQHFPNVQAHHLLVALDACSSGLAIPGTKTLDSLEEERLRKFRQLTVVFGDTEDKARNLLLAGTKNESALYLNGGIFTRALIGALERSGDLNQDGVIQFEELALYVKNQVRAKAAESGKKQKPAYYIGDHYGEGRVLFLTPEGGHLGN